VIQQRLSGSTTISAGLGPKNLIGGGLIDPGPGRLVKDLEQGPGVLTCLVGCPPERRHALDRHRSGHDLQEPAGDAEADPLGLGDGGELVLLVAGDLHGLLQPLAEGPILGLLVSQLSPQFREPSSGCGAIDGLDDLVSLAVERLTGPLAVVGHRGDVAVSAAKDGEGAGNPLGDGGHETRSVEADRGITTTIAHASTRIVHGSPRLECRFEIVPSYIPEFTRFSEDLPPIH
jgi:hypothetical protein